MQRKTRFANGANTTQQNAGLSAAGCLCPVEEFGFNPSWRVDSLLAAALIIFYLALFLDIFLA
jgi:hypothetical protein